MVLSCQQKQKQRSVCQLGNRCMMATKQCVATMVDTLWMSSQQFQRNTTSCFVSYI